jgi:quercetin dioxygenase-like cupin family protein
MHGKNLGKAIRSPVLALVLLAAFAGVALATASSGFTPTELARGTLSPSVHFNSGAVKFQTKGQVDFVTNSVAIAAGGSSGWHSHPGVTLVTVASGTVVHYDAHCVRTVYAAGTAFVESGDHPLLVRNETASPAVNIVTFLVPAGVPTRIDRPNPGCPQN